MKRIKVLHITWVFALIGLIVLILVYRGEATVFFGIAETREIFINSENAVEIKRIHVVPGQAVEKGRLLVELNDPQLTGEINKISHTLEEIKATVVSDRETAVSEINELKALKKSKISEINYQIKQLQAQSDISKDLASKLRKVIREKKGETTDPNPADPLQIKIESLKKNLELSVQPLQIKIDTLEKELAAKVQSVDIQKEKLENDLKVLLDKKNDLYILSTVDGIIGSVNFKVDEKVSPFNTILTLHTKSPAYIEGFIHENVYSRIALNQNLKVCSLANSMMSCSGEVTGIGSRIVELPERLRKIPENKVWGREVRIRIPDNNGFLLGEKVLIRSSEKSDPSFIKGLYSSLASMLNITDPQKESASNNLEGDLVQKASYDGRLRKIKKINIIDRLEESEGVDVTGIQYLKDIKKYLVINNNRKNNRPYVYLMSEDGAIDDRAPILGIEQIEKMDSVTSGSDNTIYLACSGRITDGNGSVTDNKCIMRINRDKTYLKYDKMIDLDKLLKGLIERNRKEEWTRCLNRHKTDGKYGISGMFCHEGALYIGIDRLVMNCSAVLFKLEDIDSVFEGEGKNGHFDMWKVVRLHSRKDEVPISISDFYYHLNELFMMVHYNPCNKDGNKNEIHLLSFDINNKDIKNIVKLFNTTSNGLAYNSDNNELVIPVRDIDGSFSRMMVVEKS